MRVHFATLVVGPDVERQLALYDESTRVGAYRQYVTEEEIAEERQFLEDRRLLRDPRDIAEVVRSLYDGTSPFDEIVGCDERGWYYWTTYNWLSRWDYWVLDGDRYGLLTKPGGAIVKPDQAQVGLPDVLDRPDAWQRAAPGERLRGAQSVAGEVDFVAMDAEAVENADRVWREYDVARRAGRVDELQERQVAGFTHEQFLLRHRWHPVHLVEGGRLHERGDRGLRADVTDERAAEWNRFVDQFLAELPVETLLTIVNCHS